MNNPEDLKFTRTHEWVKLEGDTALVGISKHAEEELGDVALVQLPEVGRMLQKDDKFGEVESIKAVSELYTPVAGEVVEVNSSLLNAPETVNSDPYGDGWMIKLKVVSPVEEADLLTSAAYHELLHQ